MEHLPNIKSIWEPLQKVQLEQPHRLQSSNMGLPLNAEKGALRNENMGRFWPWEAVRQLKRRNGRALVEVALWTCMLLVVFFMDSSAGQASLCPLHILGFAHCPGCGIGHSIQAALHGQFAASWNYHYLGIPATAVIVLQIIKNLYFIKKSM